MNIPSYLTIDIDYWYKNTFPVKFLERIKELNVPIAVAVHHHELLPHMNRFKHCRRLINIDYHADVCGNPDNNIELECGTWGNFVDWRIQEDTAFTWCYPTNECVVGKTNEEGCWCDINPDENPFFRHNPRKLCGWDKVSRRRLPVLKREELHNIIAIGICLSPDYLYPTDISQWTNQLYDWTKRNKFRNYTSKDEWDYWKAY